MSEDEVWIDILKKTALADNACYSAGIASEDCVVNTAAHVDKPGIFYDAIYKEGYSVEDKDTGKSVEIVEGATIKSCFETKSSPTGVYIGGAKYTFISYDKLDSTDGKHSFEAIILARPKGGAHLIRTPNDSVVIGLHEETRGQDKTNSRLACIKLAEYLADNDM
uniref:Profilin n=1 Tax=Babesia microti TaxID=5868 RepID=A0A0P0UWV2_BABMI|nr:profilin [Babesia microti]